MSLWGKGLEQRPAFKSERWSYHKNVCILKQHLTIAPDRAASLPQVWGW